MARVLFVMLDEVGHLNPTLRLAKELRARGHHVSYAPLSWPGATATAALTALGFDVAPIGAWLGGVALDLQITGKVNDAARVRAWRDAIGELARAARARTGAVPDVVLVDAVVSVFAPLFEAAGVPALLVSTSLPLYRRAGLPPPDSPLRWRRSRSFRARAEQQWADRLRAQRRDERRLARAGKTGVYQLWSSLFAQLGQRAGDVARDALIVPIARRDALVLAPRCFEFPCAAGRETFAGAALDLERADVPFPWHRLGDRRVVLCAFGSQTQLYADLAGFARALASAVARAPEYHLVVAGGERAREIAISIASRDMRPASSAAEGRCGSIDAPHVTIVERAPQLRLLERAAVFVTHCGLSSIKEAIWFGVPMLLYPRVNDQRGNAARVAYHGAGELVRDDATAESLHRQILRVDRDPAIRASVARLQAQFRDERELGDAIALIESRCGPPVPL